jgi:hypothetical protein
MAVSKELEDFIDTSIVESAKKDYHPTAFIGMRENLGTVPAIVKLVTQGDIQSGFRSLEKLGMIDWTIEAAVLKFPKDFPNREVQAAAAWRIDQAKGKKS